ncbi:MAG: hypothetical protein J0I23_22555 [Rhizobiales bacterium]|nr:hypothetical protein [Hyphomicrobiales bacterium]
MTNDIERTILELQAEVRNADPAERRQIEAELELALAEREAAMAEQEGRVDSEPPF